MYAITSRLLFSNDFLISRLLSILQAYILSVLAIPDRFFLTIVAFPNRCVGFGRELGLTEIIQPAVPLSIAVHRLQITNLPVVLAQKRFCRHSSTYLRLGVYGQKIVAYPPTKIQLVWKIIFPAKE